MGNEYFLEGKTLFSQETVVELIEQKNLTLLPYLPDRYLVEYRNSESLRSIVGVYRMTDTLREMGTPIEFRFSSQSYVYTSEVNLICGFFLKKLSYKEIVFYLNPFFY